MVGAIGMVGTVTPVKRTTESGLALIVELAGAPGSGKTTLARAVNGSRILSSGRSVSTQPLHALMQPRFGLGSRALTEGTFRQYVESRPALRRQLLRNAPRQQSGFSELLARHPRYATCCAYTNPHDPRPAEYIITSRTWIRSTIQLHADVSACTRSDIAFLLDEGIFQRSLTVLSPACSANRRDEYFQSMPCPRLLVYLDAPEDILAERLVSRPRTTLLHGLSNLPAIEHTRFALSILEAGLSVLERRGLKVVRLDATAPVNVNSQRILDEFGKLP